MAYRSVEEISDQCRKPFFFKVFIPHLTADHLAIPCAFLKHLDRNLSRMVSLIGPSGNVWHVDLVKKDEGMVFKNGWREFVTDHRVVVGDFLVFRYDGKSSFTVFVLDNTGCEKEGAFCVEPHRETSLIRVKEEQVDHREESPVEVVRENLKRKSDRGDCMPLRGCVKKRSVSSGGNLTKQSKRSLGLSSGEESAVNLHGNSIQHLVPSISPQRTTVMRAETNDVQLPGSLSMVGIDAPENERCFSSECTPAEQCSAHAEFEQSMDFWENPQVWSQTATPDSKVGVLKSQRRPVTAKEINEALKRAQSFKSKMPFTAVVMQESHCYNNFFMNLPSPFARNHLPAVSSKLTLLDPNGRSWTVGYVYYARRGAIRSGWSKFCYANNLEKGDVCVFELLKETQLQVHIFRVVEELAPLIPRPFWSTS